MVAVHVLIDLHWQKAVGGHVKSWMQFAQAAQNLKRSTLDLTLHFQGDRPEELVQSPNVRYVTHPPRLSTERLPFLQDVPSHTDLASHAPSLEPYLEGGYRPCDPSALYIWANGKSLLRSHR